MNFQIARRQRALLQFSTRILLAFFLIFGCFDTVSCQNPISTDSAAAKSTVNGCLFTKLPAIETSLFPGYRANATGNLDSLASSFANANPTALQGIVILLDAGHGGSQDGALYDSVAEKNVNLAVTLKLKARLELMGATVKMTRICDTTLSLQARVDRSIALRPDIFISVHANANRHSSIDGIETYYYNRRSANLAVFLLNSLSRGLKENANWVKREGLFVLHHNIVPSTLVEIGYLSNARTNLLLNDLSYQERVAESIARGVFNYFQNRTSARGPQALPKLKTRKASRVSLKADLKPAGRVKIHAG